MNLTSISVTQKNSVIPTGVRPSVFGWSNAVEEPAVRLLCQIAGVSIFVALIGERRCRASLDRTGEGARPQMSIVANCIYD